MPPTEEHTLEGTILPWVSMAEALGWSGGDVAHENGNTKGGTRDGLSRPAAEPSRTIDSRADQLERRRVGFPRRDDVGTSDDGYRERDFRDEDEPAFAITEKMRSAVRWPASRPAPTVTAGGTETGGAEDFGTAGRQAIEDARVADLTMRANNQEKATERGAEEPAPTIVAGHSTASRVWLDRRQTGGDGTPVAPRFADEPAPTVTDVGMARGRDVWREGDPDDVPAPRRRFLNGTHEHRAERDEAEPAPTLHFGERLNTVAWTEERPATTVAGDPRVHPPGHKVNQADRDAGRGDDYEGRAGENAIRVTVEEAALLQGFRPGFPWQGTRTKQFQQIGNAVPPPLARAILGALLGITE